MTQECLELTNNYMNYLFNSKDPVNTNIGNVLIWEEDGYVNWLHFNLAMFKYFDTDEFTNEQIELINEFKKSVEGKDGHNPYYDFYGNSLKNILCQKYKNI